jgi:[ribosomal protein S5]-alanine N-acetyltransferase
MKHYYIDGLSSERLSTRFLKPSDAEAWQEFVSSKLTTEFFQDYYSENNQLEMATKFLAKQFDRYENGTLGHQAICLKSTGEFIGLAGILIQNIDGVQEFEVGYHFLPSHWGKGYATEAAKIFIGFAKENALHNSLISIIDCGNIASIKVADKNGLIRERAINYHGHDCLIYRLEI